MVTTTLQVAAGARTAAQLFVWAKSLAFVPVIATAVRFSGPVPEFVNTTVCDAVVVPMSVFANVSEVGATVTAGEPPLPLNATVCGDPVALSVNEIAAL